MSEQIITAEMMIKTLQIMIKNKEIEKNTPIFLSSDGEGNNICQMDGLSVENKSITFWPKG